jgi:hypothetical protein
LLLLLLLLLLLAAVYRDSMSGICSTNPTSCGKHGQQCCMTIEYELPTLYGCTCE